MRGAPALVESEEPMADTPSYPASAKTPSQRFGSMTCESSLSVGTMVTGFVWGIIAGSVMGNLMLRYETCTGGGLRYGDVPPKGMTMGLRFGFFLEIIGSVLLLVGAGAVRGIGTLPLAVTTSLAGVLSALRYRFEDIQDIIPDQLQKNLIGMAVDKIFEQANLNNVPVALTCQQEITANIAKKVETSKPDSSSSDETNQAAVGLIDFWCPPKHPWPQIINWLVTCVILDCVTGVWSTMAPMPSARSSHGVVEHDARHHSAGRE